MKIGTKQFNVKDNCYVMGILNVTPDSFSDGGQWNNFEQAKRHVEEMIQEGASIIDVGGESTRPGHQQISCEEEISRVVPIITWIKQNYDIPISIDSYKSEVVEAALEAGADCVNDIWGLKYDPKVAELIAKYDVACCLMHNRDNKDYHDFFEDMCNDLKETIAIAKKAGIKDEKIILDPGVGFAKSQQQNLITIHRLEELKKLGYPVLLGTSRKSVIGAVLDLPTEQRLEGTLVTTMMAVEKDVAFVRVHDVKENVRTIRMTKAILNERIEENETSIL